MMQLKSRDFTPTGIRVEGPYENDRNADASQLFKDIIREVYGVTDVIIAHHLTYVKDDVRPDGFHYQVVEEIPAADTLIFDHEVAKKLWGKRGLNWEVVLVQLALSSCDVRDKVLADLYYGKIDEKLQNNA